MNVPIISSDGHIVEPPKLWEERLDRRFRDRAPRVVDKPGAGPMFEAPGVPPLQVAAFYALGAEGKELKEMMSKGYEAARPGAWDPDARVKDMDTDGVSAEVLYPSLGFSLFGLDDAELQLACFRIYNDWMAEFASHSPKRLFPVALISLEDVAEGVKEVERAAKLGLKGAMIWSGPPTERPYHSRIYDPFFAAAQEHGMVITMHEITAKDKKRAPRMDGSPEFLSFASLHFVHEIQETLCSLVFGGVLDRYPKLKFVSVELGAGWVPYFVWQLERRYKKFAPLAENKLAKLPSEYLRKQVFFTFEIDPIGPRVTRFFGEDNYLWASDYPHSATTWPKSRQVIADIFSDVPEPIKNKIISHNCDRLFNMNLS